MASASAPDARVPEGTWSFGACETDELAAKVLDVGWVTQYLAHGRTFEADVDAVQTSRAQLARIRFRTPCLSRGEGPSGAYVFALPGCQADSARLGGEPLEATAAGLLRPGVEHEFHTERGSELLLLAIPQEWVERETLAIWGRPLCETGKRWTFPFEHPATAQRLRASLTTLLDADVRQSDGIAGEEATRCQQPRPTSARTFAKPSR
ncbi:MAG: hypothetical protein JRH01_20065 [Deltaproteobacteria bacterium]|nr:hypothetical protein [Deltaproteobacteria bacterium]